MLLTLLNAGESGRNNLLFVVSVLSIVLYIYTQQQKKRENLFLVNLFKIKYIEFKKCMLHIKLTVYYIVGFTCNIHFLSSTYFIFNQFKSITFSRSFAAGYIIIQNFI